MRIAVIGMGSIGSRHRDNIIRLGHEAIPFDPAKGYAEMPAPPIAAIVHATPASERRINGLYKHFIEKPIAVNSKDIPAGANAFIQVGYNLRFDESLLAFRRRLPTNITSAKVWFSQRLTEWRPSDYRASVSAQKNLGGGILREASHELDLIRWLFGEWVSVYADVRKCSDLEIDVEDAVSAVITTASGVAVTLNLDMVASGYRRGIEVTTTDGKTDKWCPSWKTEKQKNAMYFREMEAFLESVDSGRLHPNAATLEDGIEALRLVEACEESSRTREVIYNPRASESEGELFSRGGWRAA